MECSSKDRITNSRGKGGEAGERTRSRNHVYQEFVPSAAWTEDSNSHYLLVDLPDFKKEEVKLQVDASGQITVRGERLVNNNKYISFEKTFKAPENSDMDNITGKFDGEILYVTLPKKVQRKEATNEIRENIEGGVGKDNEQEKPSSVGERASELETNEEEEEEERKKKKERKKGSRVDEFGTETVKKWGEEDEVSVVEKAMGILMKNRDILLTAAFAFSLGVLVSRKFDSARY
ncbi:inactive protein RESTRICTED TEV MOVEMENT 2 [Manihot esculenta]|uniref:inactive protein RESTRICTED TEV MOVEMENT 2 n=1 Tax=Manihot esculenta TaxID=3983 RepID=UPI000B5D2505|nr:inactive protein RESTRICTED TEV MOVEMENT 2 [Manihot esculenta]